MEKCLKSGSVPVTVRSLGRFRKYRNCLEKANGNTSPDRIIMTYDNRMSSEKVDFIFSRVAFFLFCAYIM